MIKFKIFARTTIFALLALGLYQPAVAQNEQADQQKFHYVITGNVKNGDKVKISLYIPSRGMENRQTVTIKDGKYKFEGEAEQIEEAVIRFEKSIVKYRGASSGIGVFLERDTVEINFKVEKDKYAWYVFKDIQVLRGETNLFYQRTKKEFSETHKGVYKYSDEKKNDSMQKNVYPEVKARMLNAYEKLYYLNEHNFVSLYVFSHSIVDSRYIFDKKYLTDAEKKRIKYFFDGLDASVYDTKEYKYVKTKVEELTSDFEPDKPISFKNFTLLNSNGSQTDIEAVVKSHKLTVIDFWWSGCSPCRKFNKKASKVYDKLKENGIEIVSINNDRGKDKWKISSEKDCIKWTNLYAGFKSDITLYYKIVRYPTMIIINGKSEIIKRGYVDDPLDLLDYLKE